MQKSRADFQTVLDTTPVPVEPVAAAAPFPVERLRLDLVDRMEELENDWRRLEALPRNPLHQGYDWCHAWQATQHHPLLLVRGSLDGRTVLILPLEAVRAHGVTVARLLGGRFNNINGGLLDEALRGLDGHAVQAIADGLKALLKGRADLLMLDTVPLIWRDHAYPLTGLRAIENPNHTFQLPLLPSFDATIAQLNAKRRRRKFRIQERRLSEKGGYDYVVAETVEEKQDLLTAFFEQKSARFRAHGLPDVFQPPQTQAFFRALADVCARGTDTPLELHAIRMRGAHEGRIAAVSGLSRQGDHVICQFGSIDDSLVPEASPGELLFWLMIERACRSGAALFDFGVGDQPYKRSWCTVETVNHDLFVPIGPKGWLLMQAMTGTTRLKAAVKRHHRLYAWLQKLRAKRQSSPAATGADDE